MGIGFHFTRVAGIKLQLSGLRGWHYLLVQKLVGIEPGFSGGTASALNPEPLLQSIRSPFNAYICMPELEKQNQHLKRTLPSAVA